MIYGRLIKFIMKIAKTIVIVGNICLASYASGDNIQQNNTETINMHVIIYYLIK